MNLRRYLVAMCVILSGQSAVLMGVRALTDDRPMSWAVLVVGSGILFGAVTFLVGLAMLHGAEWRQQDQPTP